MKPPKQKVSYSTAMGRSQTKYAQFGFKDQDATSLSGAREFGLFYQDRWFRCAQAVD
jgi:hypothetical protein